LVTRSNLEIFSGYKLQPGKMRWDQYYSLSTLVSSKERSGIHSSIHLILVFEPSSMRAVTGPWATSEPIKHKLITRKKITEVVQTFPDP